LPAFQTPSQPQGRGHLVALSRGDLRAASVQSQTPLRARHAHGNAAREGREAGRPLEATHLPGGSAAECSPTSLSLLLSKTRAAAPTATPAEPLGGAARRTLGPCVPGRPAPLLRRAPAWADTLRRTAPTRAVPPGPGRIPGAPASGLERQRVRHPGRRQTRGRSRDQTRQQDQLAIPCARPRGRQPTLAVNSRRAARSSCYEG